MTFSFTLSSHWIAPVRPDRLGYPGRANPLGSALETQSEVASDQRRPESYQLYCTPCTRKLCLYSKFSHLHPYPTTSRSTLDLGPGFLGVLPYPAAA